jgi:hypothetical protein
MPVPPERAGGFSACALAALATASVQESKSAPAADPYTGGEAQQLELLGYRSLGPFRFGSTSNELVEKTLGQPLQWVETEHFRLGSTLTEYRPEQPEEIAELKLELEALKKRLATFPARPKVLDPWLRVHLFARRLEDLYADFCGRLGVKERQPGAETPKAAAGSAVMLGDKFLVLVTQKKSTLARFTQEYCGEVKSDPVIHEFRSAGSFFFGISVESAALGDSELHYALVYGVTQNLLSGINGYAHALPPWWHSGVALWFAREREPRVLLFARPSNESLPPDELADWEPLVRGRVEAGAVLGLNAMLACRSWIDRPFGENIVLWSRIDYFLRRPGAAPPLVSALHEPTSRIPDDRAALEQASGQDLEALDRAWQDWVRETYRKKRR